MSESFGGSDYVLQLHNITKTFPGVMALKDVSFSLKRGTFHAIVGENGAGKSTLMKIIKGMYQPDSGEIYVDGEKKVFHHPSESEACGIAMVYQELQYVPELTVAENMFVGKYPSKDKMGLFVDWKAVRETAKKQLEDEGLTLDLDAKIGQLAVCDIQMLEIVKVVSQNAKVIIMDEPTSSLSNNETARLFKKMDELRSRGISIIYISHKLEEIFKLADYVSVFRDGEVIDTRPLAEFDRKTMIKMMVGRDVSHQYPKEEVPIGDVCLEVKNLELNSKIKNISLYTRKGEIVGIAGMVGAGRTEVFRAVAGLDHYRSGEVLVDGKEVKDLSVNNAVENGIATVTEDRRRTGIVGLRSILQNIALPNLDSFEKAKIFVSDKEEKEQTKAIAKQLGVKAPSMNSLLYTLSGGNQQKVIIAKWILRKPKVFILDEPTRGIDIGAKYEIYKLIIDMVREGISVILISSELPELLGMCDRMYVMNGGKIAGELQKGDITADAVMELAAGGQCNE